MNCRIAPETVLAICFLLSGIVCSPERLSAQELQAGAAKRIITPEPLLPISGGVGPGAPSHAKQGELTTRALVLRSGETTVAMVIIDALGFPSVLADRVRARVPEIKAENILIGATHTHSAPDCYAFPDGQGGHTGDLAYMERVCQLSADAINEALVHLKPVSLKVATAEAQGQIAFNYYAPDLYDRRVGVMQVSDATGRAVATLINYAVHPEVLGAKQGITSPDMIGPLCDRIEADQGGMALFFNGAQGGMVTADNRELDKPSDPLRGYWSGKSDWAECQRIGQLLADESLRVLKSATVQDAPKLECRSANVRFPVDNDLMRQIIQGSPLNYPRNADGSIQARINFVRLGSLHILTVPGEALPNIGFYLKRKMQGQHNWLFGLTNDAFGYILTRVDFASFKRYEYISRTSLGEETGEILIDQSLKLIAP